MAREFSNIELADIHYVFGEARGCTTRAREIYYMRFPNRRLPDRKTFLCVDQWARDTGMLMKARSRGRSEIDSDLEDRILNRIQEDPTTSTRQIAATEGVSHTTTWRKIKEHEMHPYHYQRVQQLEEGDRESRRNFCRWMLQKLRRNEDFVSQILFTNEAGFDRKGVFNFHNEYVWTSENPHAVVEKNTERQFSCNVWAGIVNENLIGPVILPSRLTGQYYLEFLQNELLELLEDIPLSIRRDMWYMHDEAPPHSINDVSEFLNSTFTDKWIGRRGPVPWPARSPDLNPLHFFFWDHFKTLVYSTPVNTREDLVQRILFTGGIIQNVTADFKAINRNLRRRIELCLEQNGGHFEHLLQSQPEDFELGSECAGGSTGGDIEGDNAAAVQFRKKKPPRGNDSLEELEKRKLIIEIEIAKSRREHERKKQEMELEFFKKKYQMEE